MKTKIGLPLGLALVMFIGVFTAMLALGALNPQSAEAEDDFSVSLSNTIPNHRSDWSFSVPVKDGFWAGVTDGRAASTIDITFPGTGTVASDVRNAATAAMHWKLGGKVVTVPPSGSGETVVLTAPDGMEAVLADGMLKVEYNAPEKGPGTTGITNPDAGTEYELTVIVTVDADEDGTLDSPSPAALDSNPFVIGTEQLGQVEVTSSSDSPRANVEYVISFYTGEILTANEDKIQIRFDKDIGVPTSISANDILIKASVISGDENGDGPGGQATRLAGSPSLVTVNKMGLRGESAGDPKIKEYTFTVPDLDVADNNIGNISMDAKVTITITVGAGLTNPKEAGTGDTISVASTEGAINYFVSDNLVVGLKLSIDDVEDKRNTPLTIIGKGYKAGTTATVWLDHNQNAMIDPDETRLISDLVESDGTFEFTVNVSVPPFEKSNSTRKNYINAIDTEAPTANVIKEEDADDMPQFTVDRSLTVSPASANVGDTVRLELRDYSALGSIQARPSDATDETEAPIKIAGVKHWPESTTTITDGDADLEVVIQNGVPPGTHEIRLEHGEKNAETKLTVGGATLILTPSSAVPNQTISVVGRGFSSGSTINEDGPSRVSIGGDSVGLKGSPSPSPLINGGDEVTTDSGGNWATEIILPMNNATLTPGTYQFKVTDSDGRVGETDLIILPRTLEMSPVQGRVGSTVTVTGSGFPADNSSSDAPNPPNVTISYAGDRRESATPDSEGNFTTSFRVPSVGIPSTNVVEADFEANKKTITVSQTHDVPEGIITLEPTEVRPGDTITITGEGFAGFEQMTLLDVGTRELTPSPRVTTARDGTFTVQVLIPDFDPGSVTVKATVGKTIASATLSIVSETTQPMMPEVMMSEEATPDVAFAAVIAEDNLVKVFHFDPATQNEAPNYGWTIYDARPLFMKTNTLSTITPGGFYFLQVKEDQMGVEIGGRTIDLYAGLNPVQW